MFLSRMSLLAFKSIPLPTKGVMDTVSKEVRSRMMSKIRSKDTAPELELRRALFARGLRYRLHVRALPGTPDMVLTKWKAIIFVHGCFWHGHACRISRIPKSNQDYWSNKINRNAHNDQRNRTLLSNNGWRVFVVWECAMRGATKEQKQQMFEELEQKIRNFALGSDVPSKVVQRVQ